MSNISNFFGSSNGVIRPAFLYADATIGTGDPDPGSDVLLGGTQGLTLRFQEEKSPITYDQYGTSPANQVTTGETCEVEGSLVQTTLTRIEQVLAGATAHSSGSEGFTLASTVGQDDLSQAVKLKMALTIGEVASTDPDEILIIPLATPQARAEWVFDAATQRVLNVMFKVYKSPNYVRTTDGAKLWAFTKRAWDMGHVSYVTG